MLGLVLTDLDMSRVTLRLDLPENLIKVGASQLRADMLEEPYVNQVLKNIVWGFSKCAQSDKEAPRFLNSFGATVAKWGSLCKPYV